MATMVSYELINVCPMILLIDPEIDPVVGSLISFVCRRNNHLFCLSLARPVLLSPPALRFKDIYFKISTSNRHVGSAITD